MIRVPRKKQVKSVKYVVEWLDCISHFDDIDVAKGYTEEKVEKYGKDCVRFYKETTTVETQEIEVMGNFLKGTNNDSN